MGGLGNQMFQYAFGKSMAIQQHTILKLDRTFLDDKSPKENFTFRDYELDIFDIVADFATTQEIRSYFHRPLFNRLFGLPNKKKVVKEHLLDQPFTVADLCEHMYFEGYWQKENYFLSQEEEIRKAFRFRSAPVGRNLELAQHIASTPSIAVHVRRGDYASNAVIQSVHGVLGPEYYRQAASIVESSVSNPHYFVFSDDSEWTKKNIQLGEKCTYIDHNTGKNSFEDMRLMSLCQHNIIANSSFSWWSAWLNTHKGKIVVAPSKWFHNLEEASRHSLPPSWIKI